MLWNLVLLFTLPYLFALTLTENPFEYSRTDLEGIINDQSDFLKKKFEHTQQWEQNKKLESPKSMLPSYIAYKDVKTLREGVFALMVDCGGSTNTIKALSISKDCQVISHDELTISILHSDNILSSPIHQELPFLSINGEYAAIKMFDRLAQLIKVIVFEAERKGFLKEGQAVHISFVFSFPFVSLTMDSGRTISLCKGAYDDKSNPVIGKDPSVLLKAALDDQRYSVDVLMNDSVGTMLTSLDAFKKHRILYAFIAGTGFNGAIIGPDGKIYNIEYAPVFSTWYHRNFLDAKVDSLMSSKLFNIDILPSPTNHVFEKLVSGKYLGEFFLSLILSHLSSFTLQEQAYFLLFLNDVQLTSKILVEIYELGPEPPSRHTVVEIFEQNANLQSEHSTTRVSISGEYLSDEMAIKLVILSGWVVHRFVQLLSCSIASVVKFLNVPRGEEIHITAVGSLILHTSPQGKYLLIELIQQYLKKVFDLDIGILANIHGSAPGALVALKIALAAAE